MVSSRKHDSYVFIYKWLYGYYQNYLSVSERLTRNDVLLQMEYFSINTPFYIMETLRKLNAEFLKYEDRELLHFASK